MAKRNLRTLLGRLGLVALTCCVLGVISFAPSGGSVQAAGHTASRALASPPGPTPEGYGPDHCLEINMFTFNADNTNQATLTGEVFNNCGFTVASGRTDFFGYEQCAGTSKNDETYANWVTLYPGDVMPFNAQLTGLCEVCQNGTPVSWPPFTLVVQVDASGTGLNNQVVEDTGTGEKSVGLSNSSNYSFPC